MIAGGLFYSNLRDIRKDAKDEATRVATDESRDAVKRAFEEEHVKKLVEDVAKEKISAVTDDMVAQKVNSIADKVIEQRLSSKLQPIEQRIVLMTRISDCETRIKFDSRDGYVELVNIVTTTHDADVAQFGKKVLDSIVKSYDAAWVFELKQSKQPPFDFLKAMMTGNGKQPPANLSDVVRIIGNEQSLSLVALAFDAFRDMTGEKVKMFDFVTVKSWCSKNPGKCQ